MKKYHFVIADVFTDEPFGGNQLAVFVDGQGLSQFQMQKLAQEMNYSETTFLLPSTRPDCEYRVRIFTPEKELPFAGHPLVGTGYVIGARNLVALQGKVKRVNLDVKIGVVPVDLDIKQGEVVRTTMTQPQPEFLKIVEDVEALAAALGLAVDDIRQTNLPVEVVSTGLPAMIVPVATLGAVQKIRVNPMQLIDFCEENGAQTVLVFTRETVQQIADIHCRVFAPAAGVLEDAATGSANGPFGSYLVAHGVISTPPLTRIVSEQGCEMNRPSLLYLEIEGEGRNISAVRVSGNVVIVGEGEMFVGS